MDVSAEDGFGIPLGYPRGPIGPICDCPETMVASMKQRRLALQAERAEAIAAIVNALSGEDRALRWGVESMDDVILLERATGTTINLDGIRTLYGPAFNQGFG